MKRTWILVAVLIAALPATAGADTSKDLAAIAAKTKDSLAMVSCTIESVVPGKEGTIRGLGICVNAQSGLFMTLALDATTQTKRLKDFELLLPGPTGKSLKAKLLGIDPTTGITFVQATEPHPWTVVQFAPSAALSLGQEVVSVGLMGGDGGRTQYLGVGYISAIFRVPGELVYVTGGKLTAQGSPVFLADGRAIGIVGRQQLPMTCQMITSRGSANVRLVGLQETGFFIPVGEFEHVLRAPPTAGAAKRLPWIGVVGFTPVDDELKELLKLTKPGVTVGKVVEGHPADRAGLKSRDVIVAMDGKGLEKLATPALVATDFFRDLMRKAPGKSVTLTVLRAGKEQQITITLAPMPKQPYEADFYVQRRLGFIAREKVEMDKYTDPNVTAKVDGVVVTVVGQRTAAAAGGLRGGDLVTTVSDQKVTSLTAFKQIVDGAVANKPNQALNLLIQRGSETQAISIQVPPPPPAGRTP